MTRALSFPRLVFGLYLVIFFTSADAPPKRAKPVAEHLFFRCKLFINPSSKEVIADALIETNGGKKQQVYSGGHSGHKRPDACSAQANKPVRVAEKVSRLGSARQRLVFLFFDGLSLPVQ
jgi:hypothetical protein